MSDYGYIMGVVRSKERTLLNAVDLERMVDAHDAAAAFKVLNDTDFADNMLDVPPERFNEALDADFAELRRLYEAELPDGRLLEFLYLRYDIHNLKLALKSKYLERDMTEMESDLGLVDRTALHKYVADKSVNLSDSFKQIADVAIGIFEEKQDPVELSSQLDKLMFKRLVEITDEIASSFLTELLRLQIDVMNIKTTLRAKMLDKNKNFLSEQLVDGGNREIADYFTIYDGSISEIVKELSKFFDNKIEVILDEFEKNNSLPELELKMENYELEFIKKTKMLSPGPELPVAYYYAKKNAIRNIRLVMIGKLNNLKPEEIKAHVKSLW